MVPSGSDSHFHNVLSSISFSGSGFMATYQLGVVQCFLNYAPWIVCTAPCVLGASAGSLVAAAVVCEISPITILYEMLHLAKQVKAFTLGPFDPSISIFHWLECVLRKYLPSDAHQLASGRLAVAMTRLVDGKNICMSEFRSKEDVVQALLCSCFVPVYCGMMPPTFRGVQYMDGGFSSMQPVSGPASHTLTVSPYSGEADICPADPPCMWDVVVAGTSMKLNMANSFRMLNSLYPRTLEVLEQAYHNGYKDAFHFLLQKGLAPYFVIHRTSQKPINCDKTETLMHLDTTTEEEQEMKVGKETATLTSSCIDNRLLQMGSEWTEKRPIKIPPLHFDMMKNVLLGNVVTYLSMSGLPARILSYVLLPLMLLLHAVLQSRTRLEMLFRLAPGWTCWSFYPIVLFLFKIILCSLRKNIIDRVMAIIALSLWLKTQGVTWAETLNNL